MKKILFLFLLSLLTMTVAAQKFSWPPKSYPLSVPFIVSDEVKYYWGVDAIVCVGFQSYIRRGRFGCNCSVCCNISCSMEIVRCDTPCTAVH